MIGQNSGTASVRPRAAQPREAGDAAARPSAAPTQLRSPSTERSDWFHRAARSASTAAGRPLTFLIAITVVVAWAVAGPFVGYTDTWQLVINTGTTVVTFLMVFLIQNSQNRDAVAIQIKLDELIRSIEGARNGLLDLEDLDEETLERVRGQYLKLASQARSRESGSDTLDEESPDTDAPSSR